MQWKKLIEEKNYFLIRELKMGREDSPKSALSEATIPTKQRKSGKHPGPQMFASPSAKKILIWPMHMHGMET